MRGEVIVAMINDLAHVVGGLMEKAGPVLTIFKVEAGLDFIDGRNPDIKTGAAPGNFEDGIESVGEGDANLARFLHNFEGGGVEDPGDLVGEEEGHRGKAKG